VDTLTFTSRSRQVWRTFGASLGHALVGPHVVDLEVTHHCNLHCVFCESHGSLQAAPVTERRTYVGGRQTMDLPTIRRLAGELARAGVDLVELSGKGDPLAHPDRIEIVRAIKGTGMACSMVTNATLAPPGLASELVELGLDRVNVSLNAGTGEIYQRINGCNLWDKAVSFLQDVLSHRRAAGHRRPWVRVSHVVCRDNLDDFDNMVQICLDLGVDEVVLTVMGELRETVHLRLTPEDVTRLLAGVPKWQTRLDQAGIVHNLSEFSTDLPIRSGEAKTQENPLQRTVPCYVGWFFCVIGPDGVVVPCCYCEEEILGNIHEQSFAKIWHGATYRRFRGNSLALPRTGRPICRECFTTCNKAAENLRIFKRSRPYRRDPTPVPSATA
jgi:radical SAM protein with 4Fe4S-binding SPASM domain